MSLSGRSFVEFFMSQAEKTQPGGENCYKKYEGTFL